MTISCDIAANSQCVCIQRQIKEKSIYAGGLFYGYGSVPAGDSILENGIHRAVVAVAGSVAHILEQAMNDDQICEDLHQVAHLAANALRTASRNLWELRQCSGQGIYVGGVLAYFCGTQYIVSAFGGAGLFLFENGQLRCLVEPAGNRLIYDALGGKNGWSGKFAQGLLSSGDILFGATDLPHNWQSCEERLREYVEPGIHVVSGAMILRQGIISRAEEAAVIEFRNVKEGGVQ